MSGPKVVRIVTREEIEAICGRHIAAVEAAAVELRRRARRCGMLDATLEQALAGRLAAFKAMFARQAWMDIQKGGPQAVAFMQSEGDRLLAAAAMAAATARTRGRRAADAARSVAAAIEATGGTVPPGLRAAAAGGATPDEAERQVVVALTLIPAQRADPAASAAQRELGRRLGAGEGARSIADLIAARAPEPTTTERRLDVLLAELGLVADDTGEFGRRADAVAREPDASHRALLTDSLVLDAAAHVAAIRAREAAVARMRAAAASMASLPSQEAKALRARLAAAVDGRDLDVERSLVAAAADMVDADARDAASLARRRAILSGLASLGYEVRETMEAAWARDGRLVVRKPGATDYGVELGAPADTARLQVRLVGSDRPAAPRDAHRDADQETIWCSEFDHLKEGLARAGDELVIETALSPGQVALRSVAMELTGQAEQAAASPRARTAPPR